MPKLTSLLTVITGILLVLVASQQAFSQQGTAETVLLDFGDINSLEGSNTTHKADVTRVEDTHLESAGKFTARAVVDTTAGADKFFGAGFGIDPVSDLSKSDALQFWIKTDIKSQFNFQLHSVDGGTGIFPFSITNSPPGTWQEITIPLDKLKMPPWSKRTVDLSRIKRIQVTAHGSGPYDGKTITLDQVVTSQSGKSDLLSPVRPPRPIKEPVILNRGELVDLFDGKTLAGWFATPRVYVPKGEKFARMPSARLYDAVIKHYEESPDSSNRILHRERVKNKGVWKVVDGAIIGGQMPGSIAGSYLMTEKSYGDFELTLETNPDYPIDTGIMIRAHKLGSVGFQVLVDNRPNGTIGGVFGNSVGMFFAYPFVFDADEEPLNRMTSIRPGKPNALKFPGGQFQTDYAASFEDFLKVWKPNEWNKIKIRCTGRLPLIETWINGVPIAKLDTATLSDLVPDYDPEAIFERIGRKGHIGLEVHDSPTRDRWAPGALCRWRNLQIRELEISESAN